MNKTTYIVQKKVVADSVQEALKKEKSTPVNSIYPEAKPEGSTSDAIGYKYVPVEE
jgi:ACT domain-containing protein